MIQQLLGSIKAYQEAFYLVKKLRLWGYFLIPALVCLFFGFTTYKGASALMGNISSWSASIYPWEWGSSLVEGTAYWVGLVLVLASSLLVYKHIILILVSPFMGSLSQKVEQYLTNGDTGIENSGAKGFIRGLRIALRNITREILYTIAIFFLSFIPIIGLFAAAFTLIIQAYYAGFGNMDYTLERHYGVRDSAYFVKKHRGIALGNGFIFIALLLSGVGVLIAPPLATIAATIEVVPRVRKAKGFV